MESENSKTSPPNPTIFTKPIFILFGIGALLTYNAFLTELPFFNHFLSDMSPGKSIPFLNFILNLTFQFLILWKKDLFKLRMQLIIGLISSILFLIVIPIVVVKLEKNSILNIALTSFLILIMGFINALLTSGFYSLASFFPLDILVSLNSGMAIAGILMNVIEYIVLFAVETGDEENDKNIITCALTFFIISGFILLVCLIILLYEFKKDYYRYYLRTLNKEIAKENIQETENQLISEGEANEPKKEKTELSFMKMFKILRDIDLLGMYIYIITASLYPNACIRQNLFNLKESYNVNTILIIINTCDTIGRYLVVKVKPSKKLTAIVILSRTIFVVTLILNYYLEQNGHGSIGFTSSFLLFNIISLAISNGVGTSLCFGIAPTLVEDEYKGQAGASVSFFATFGTFTGTLIAFLTSDVMDSIE